jgi:hypothetical protein
VGCRVEQLQTDQQLRDVPEIRGRSSVAEQRLGDLARLKEQEKLIPSFHENLRHEFYKKNQTRKTPENSGSWDLGPCSDLSAAPAVATPCLGRLDKTAVQI